MSLKDLIPNTSPIAFPGLFGDWRFTAGPKALDLGNGIYWYGVLIACGMLLAIWFCMKQAPKFSLTEDNVMDTGLWCIPAAILGARAYYIIFYLDLYKNADGSLDFGRMVRIWDGGLAVYGGLIAAFLTGYAVSRAKRFSYLAMADNAVMGVLIGQSIGRWGNFVNVEAFGSYCTGVQRMVSPHIDAYLHANPSLLPGFTEEQVLSMTEIPVHPTFFYESMWLLLGFVLLALYTSRRRYDGELALLYFFWNGLGRFWIEGLRTDSLMLGSVRVSQLLAAVLVVVSAVLLLWANSRYKTGTLPDWMCIVKWPEKPAEENDASAGPAAGEETPETTTEEEPDGKAN